VNGGLALAGLDATTFLLCAAFITYVLVILVPYMRHRRAAPGDETGFEWHFIVPCLNEEAVVDTTVRRLADRFPTAQLWCVDDGSSDATPILLGNAERELANVHVVTRRYPEARQGKGPALNAGWAAIRAWLPDDADTERVLVGVIDADGDLDADCPAAISGAKFFGNSKVGAVQIRVRVAPAAVTEGRVGRALCRLQDVEFGGVIAAMQLLRRYLGSVGMGGNGQFTRMSTLDRIARDHGSPWHGALLEDFELGLHVLLTGGRTEYCHDTAVTQEGLPTVRQLVRQRSRWAQGCMQCFRYLLPVLASEDISLGGALEITYFLFMPWLNLVGGVLYVASGCVLAWYAFIGSGGLGQWWASGAWGVVPLFLFFGLGPLVLWGPVYRAAVDRSLTRRRALLLGLAHWPYIYIHHAATWVALGRVVRARHDWVKTDRRAPAWADVFGTDAARVPASFVLTSARPRTRRVDIAGRLVLVHSNGSGRN
jgi:cellulose synthase/poly-beta-1,6-N-acetylglucosamine synthase-like glycosyltransferase